MVKEEKPRGLRARLRQRRARNSSDDEVQSRPTSLDLGRRAPAMLAAGMHSMTSMPTRSDGHHFAGNSMESNSGTGGLALGEFATEGGEIAENEEYLGDTRPEGSKQRTADVRPSGAIVRSSSHDHVADYDQSQQRQRQLSQLESKARRESSQSVPSYDSKVPDASTRRIGSHDAFVASPTQSRDADVGSGSESEDEGEYSYDEDEDSNIATNEGSEFDADSELNAVYLKRNADFHMLFRNIPINELLIDDYGCALQRDILVQGRLYLTENFVCFYSNIFGWVTNLIIAFDEIVSIEKRMTALIIPNAIQISTLHAKHFFGSFIYRDSAYNQLYDLWAKTRNEKNAGLPEIGSAEVGDGAGDVSRHREDVVDTAYQSLTEDSDASGSRHRSALSAGELSDVEEGSVSDTGSDVSAAGSVSRSGSETDDSRSLSVNGGRSFHKQSSRGLGSDTMPSSFTTGSAEGLVDALPGDSESHQTHMLGMYAGGDGGKEPQSARTATASQSDFNDATPTAPQTATGSTADVTLPGTTANGSQVIGLAGAAAGPSATEVAGMPDASSRLLTRLSKSSVEADAGAGEHTVNGIKHKRRKRKEPHASQLHSPTICPCGTTGKTAHYAQEAMDAVFPLSLPVLFRVLFSASVPPHIEKTYIPSDQVDREELDKSCTQRIIESGNSDVKTEGWVPDPSDSCLEMCIYSYEKPLGFSIGPKSTIVEDTYRVTVKDFDRAVIIEQVVKTPNIPSGTSFFVKIRHCLTWAAGPDNLPPGGCTHYRMTFEVEWTKNSWIKSAIEKGTVDSNKQAGEMAEKYIREWIKAHPSMEIKPLSHDSVSKTLSKSAADAAIEAASSAHTRRKKGGRRSKRGESPRGLRMKELLQGSSAAQRNRLADSEGHEYAVSAGAGGMAAAGASVGANAIPSLSATPEASAVEKAWADDAAAWKRRADASWIGWLGFQLVYPLQRMLTDPIVAPVLIIALALLLFMSNMWRISLSANEQQLFAGSVLRPAVNGESMERMQRSIDLLTAQMGELGQQIQQLLAERQNQKLQ
ncbi:hypothetical protein COEREDRAFT_89213 [Coemansia reversa NRRL 1564]|uniref:VASt domain-containing protein n=1 Tax=Coemansia reversa (strain ATCC 12441 / NRRL 1564) TaxID=763665 RepID=A0A2G5B4A9_COERN|nr:hypothetical protein COEREDRAFT_89213 [Coemansia reversa NRRL 1564]|eukprot:PIA13883.1 hypothetical protein COEREDRAFT_89213 [Coemansia reversa NRRL 1564]